MEIDWQSVVLLLGITGMAFAAVCFAIWILRPEYEEPTNYKMTDLSEQDTAIWKTPDK